MKLFQFLAAVLTFSVLSGCHNGQEASDAYGNFEAREIVVSAEASGKLLRLALEEGEEVKEGQSLGVVDTMSLHLKKKQLVLSKEAIRSKLQDEKVQIDLLLTQKENLQREVKRIDRLYEQGAATAKQRDDLRGELDVINNRIASTRSQLSTANRGLLAELAPLEAQIEQIEDQIKKSIVTSPVSGTVLTKYAEEGEVVTFGKPLFKVANLQELTLRAYVSAPQLAAIQTGQKVTVLTDTAEGELRSTEGTIAWISPSAEFTPKIIQTREERVNLVYAIKVLVPNNGSLKIGMPAEVKF